jgi:CRISPR/Cas system-associated endonuclease Cas1
MSELIKVLYYQDRCDKLNALIKDLSHKKSVNDVMVLEANAWKLFYSLIAEISF